jgi:uncharacterized membrane protein
MLLLLVGLALFLGAHSVQILAPGVRNGFIASRGAGAWKGLYSLISLAGFVLIIIGYGKARGGVALLPDMGLKPVAFGLAWLGFILVAAAHIPANHFRSILRDPMVFGVGLWALAHLLVRSTPAGLALFGGFLVWAVVDFISLRMRGGAAPAAPKVMNTVIAILAGTVLGALFVHLLHKLLIGVSPI